MVRLPVWAWLLLLGSGGCELVVPSYRIGSGANVGDASAPDTGLLADSASPGDSNGTDSGGRNDADGGLPMDAGPDTESVPDSATVPDVRVDAPLDAPRDSAGQESSAPADASDGSMCPSNDSTPTLPWAPPTAFHQNACTPAQITTFIAALTSPDASSGSPSSGSTICDGCLLTPETASMFGPVITVNGSPALFNLGGCIANESGSAQDRDAGGCANQVNNLAECLQQECASCTTEANVTACETTVMGPTAVCESMVNPSCDAELNGDAGMYCGTVQAMDLLTLWCGP